MRPLLCGAGLIAPLSTLNFLAEWGCLLMDQDVIVKKTLSNLLSLEFVRRSKSKIWNLVTPTVKKKKVERAKE